MTKSTPAKVAELRAAMLTWTDISARLDISEVRARQLYEEFLDKR